MYVSGAVEPLHNVRPGRLANRRFICPGIYLADKVRSRREETWEKRVLSSQGQTDDPP